MAEKIILYAIIAAAVSTVLAFLTKGSGKAVSTDSAGRYSLRMNKLYGMMGYVGLSFGLFFMIFIPLVAEQIDSVVLIGILLVLLFSWGPAIPCLMYYKNHSVLFDDKSIKVNNVYGHEKEVNWSDLTDIKFKPLTGLLNLYTGKEIIKVHQHLVGLSKFVEYLENKTKWTRKELKIPIGK